MPNEEDPVLTALRDARDGARMAAEAAKPLAQVPDALSGLSLRLAALEEAVQRKRWVVAALLVLAGLCVGVVIGVRLFPSSLMATEPGCRIAGGTYFPAAAGRGDACVFYAR